MSELDEDKIRDILNRHEIKLPNDATQKAHLNLAEAAFDRAFAEKQKKFQGFSILHRLIGTNPLNQGEPIMKKLYIISGVAACTILGVGLTQTTSLTSSVILSHILPQQENISRQPTLEELGHSPQQLTKEKDDSLTEAFLMPQKDIAPADMAAGAPSSAASMPQYETSNMMMKREIAPSSPLPYDMVAPVPQEHNQFEEYKDNPLKIVADEPVSTFSIDVDTASYSFVRSSLNLGQMPAKDSVRVEELINYFDYDYAVPSSKAEPFKPTVALYPTPWNKNTQLMHIGIKGYAIEGDAKPRSNLTFLIDTSGSMAEPNKLPLLIQAFSMMVNNLSPDDTVSIVTYAGSAGQVLEPTKVSEKDKILAALQNLQAGGSTAGGQGIELAYASAAKHFDKEGVNRVILATDGDFNVGISDPAQLEKFIEEKRKSGVFLSVLGFGRGNYNDHIMQSLAQHGNGTAAYIDTLGEARKVLVEEASSTLFTIAKDVKIQVEFNPAAVSEYRLIGYETRALNREDFNNDKVDAGELGAGHSVTAIYEITPAGSEHQKVDPLRYSKAQEKAAAPMKADEVAFLKLRYKLPKSDSSTLMTTPIKAESLAALDTQPESIRFAAAVAAFGQKLRGHAEVKDFSYSAIADLANRGKGDDEFGSRAEFIQLVKMAEALDK